MPEPGPAPTGEPVLAWLERRTARQRTATVEFDNPRLEYRRLFSEAWGTFLLCWQRPEAGLSGRPSTGVTSPWP